MKLPFRGSCGILNQILVGVSRERVLTIDTIVRQLINVGIALIRHAFSISIDIDTTKRSYLDAVLADVPYSIKGVIRGSECGSLIVKRLEHSHLLQVSGFDTGYLFYLGIPKGKTSPISGGILTAAGPVFLSSGGISMRV